ncbi:uncharacterized protein LOC100214209 isoform X2 [Hydra vulgaris]|uniref:Uncharacterized protein LOC100214209 isoform X2 n=1 Tax=Hydra vulgaris TaxID=6087 RepID=A0ABM4D373_HYDVU
MKCKWLEVLLLLSICVGSQSRPVVDNSEILQVIKDISSLDSLISENDAADDNDDDDEEETDKDSINVKVLKDANSTKKALIHNTTVNKDYSVKNEIAKSDKETEVDTIPVGQRLTSEQKIESKPNAAEETKSSHPESKSQEVTNEKAVEKLTEKNSSQEKNVTATDSSAMRNQKSKENESNNKGKESESRAKSLISKKEEKAVSSEDEEDDNDDEEEEKESEEVGSGADEDVETKSNIENTKKSENKTPKEETQEQSESSFVEPSSIESSSSMESSSVESDEIEPEEQDEKVKMFFISPFEKSKDKDSTTRQVLTYPAVSQGSSIHHHGSPSHVWSSDYPYFAYGYSWGCGNHINSADHHVFKKSKLKNHKDNKKSDLLCRDYMLLPAITPAAIRAVEEKEENAKTRQNVIAKDIACSEDDTDCTQRQVIGNMAGGSLFGDGMGGLGMGFPGIGGIHTGVSGYNLAGGLGHNHGHGIVHEYGHGDGHGSEHGFPHSHEYHHGYEVGNSDLGNAYGGGFGDGLDSGVNGYNEGLGHYAVSNKNDVSSEKAEKKANVKNKKHTAKKKHIVGTLDDENESGYQGINQFGGEFGNTELAGSHGLGSRVVYPTTNGITNGIYGENSNVLGVGLKNKNILNTDIYAHPINNAPSFNLPGGHFASSNLVGGNLANFGGVINDRFNNFGSGNIVNDGSYPLGTFDDGRMYNNDAEYEPESGNMGDGVGHPYYPNSHTEENDGYGPPIMGPPLRNAFGYSNLEHSFQNNPGAMKVGYGGSIGHIGGLEVNGIHSNFAYKSKIKKKKNKKQVRGNVRQDIAMPDEQAMMDVTKQRQLIGSLGASTLFSDNVGGMGLGYPGIPGMSSGISGIPGEYGGNGGYGQGWSGHGTGLHPHGYNNYADEEGHGGDFGNFGSHGEETSHEGGYDRSNYKNMEQENQQNHEEALSQKRGIIYSPAEKQERNNAQLIASNTVDIPAQDLDDIKYLTNIDRRLPRYVSHLPNQLSDENFNDIQHLTRYNSNSDHGDLNYYQPRHVHIGVGTPNVKVEVETSKSEIAHNPSVHVSFQKMSEIKKLVHEVSDSLKRTNIKLNALKKGHAPNSVGGKRQITPAFTPVVAEPVGVPDMRYPVPAADRYPLGAGYIWPSRNYGLHHHGGPGHMTWSKSHTPKAIKKSNENEDKDEKISIKSVKEKNKKQKHKSGKHRRSVSSKTKKHERVGTKRQFLEHPMSFPHDSQGYGFGMGYPMRSAGFIGHGGMGGYGVGHFGHRYGGHMMRGMGGFHNGGYNGYGGHSLVIHNPVHMMAYGGNGYNGVNGYGREGSGFGREGNSMMDNMPIHSTQFSGLSHSGEGFEGHHIGMNGGYYPSLHSFGGVSGIDGGHSIGGDSFINPPSSHGPGEGYGFQNGGINGGVGMGGIGGFGSAHQGFPSGLGGNLYNNFAGFNGFNDFNHDHNELPSHGSGIGLDPGMSTMGGDVMHSIGMGHPIGLAVSQGVPGGNAGLNLLGGAGEVGGSLPIGGMQGADLPGGLGGVSPYGDHGNDQGGFSGGEGGLPGFGRQNIETMRQNDQSSSDSNGYFPGMGHADNQDQMNGPTMADSRSSMFFPLKEAMTTYGSDLRAMDYPGASKKSEVPLQKKKRKNKE